MASSSLLFVVAARTSEAIYSGGRCQFFLLLLGAGACAAPILVYCCYYNNNNNNIELTMVAYLQLNKYCVTFAFSVLWLLFFFLCFYPSLIHSGGVTEYTWHTRTAHIHRGDTLPPTCTYATILELSSSSIGFFLQMIIIRYLNTHTAEEMLKGNKIRNKFRDTRYSLL